MNFLNQSIASTSLSVALAPAQTADKQLRLTHPLLVILFVIAAFQAFFASVPWVDLWFSALFWNQSEGFYAKQSEGLVLFREIAKDVFTWMSAPVLVGWILAFFKIKIGNIPGKVWGFIFCLYALGPGLLVNGILKSYWGRARPADVTQFGGTKEFSPPFEIVSQCEKNCSFVSGEAAGAAAFAVSIFVLSRFIPNSTVRQIIVGLATVVSLSAALLRVVFGRHFLSDVTFATLFVGLVALGLMFVFGGKSLLMPAPKEA